MQLDVSDTSASDIERAAEIGRTAALEDLLRGHDRSGEDVIADTEVLVFTLTGCKLYELEEDTVIPLIEAHDEAYIETFMSGAQD